ncbi:hypothetical protein LY76DRAFT_587234 [Colletotrichum caudatum]|nr:hypothetical protein LY76DRAFT_587234 [Colletotrichum caudatum]
MTRMGLVWGLSRTSGAIFCRVSSWRVSEHRLAPRRTLKSEFSSNAAGPPTLGSTTGLPRQVGPTVLVAAAIFSAIHSCLGS